MDLYQVNPTVNQSLFDYCFLRDLTLIKMVASRRLSSQPIYPVRSACTRDIDPALMPTLYRSGSPELIVCSQHGDHDMRSIITHAYALRARSHAGFQGPNFISQILAFDLS